MWRCATSRADSRSAGRSGLGHHQLARRQFHRALRWGWIVEIMGRKKFFLVCIALFTISSLLCGFAWSLHSLLLFRVMQGLAGGGMTPVAQSILAAAFPPEKRAKGSPSMASRSSSRRRSGRRSAAGSATIVSWHWCFLINVPVGLISLVLIFMLIPCSPEKKKERRGFGQGHQLRHGRLSAVAVSSAPSRWCSTAARRRTGSVRASSYLRGDFGHRAAAVHPVGAQPAEAPDRHQDADRTAVRHLLSDHAGDRRAPDRDHTDPAAAAAGRVRLHRHAGRAGDFAGRHGDDGDDGRGWPARIHPAAISDRRGCRDRLLRDGRPASPDARCRLLVSSPGRASISESACR